MNLKLIIKKSFLISKDLFNYKENILASIKYNYKLF